MYILKVYLRPTKKVVLLPEIGLLNFFYHFHDRIAECVSEYIFLISKQNKKTIATTNNYKTKSKETEEEKIMSMENVTDLTGYDDIVCEYALCTFNLLDRDINFSRLFI